MRLPLSDASSGDQEAPVAISHPRNGTTGPSGTSRFSVEVVFKTRLVQFIDWFYALAKTSMDVRAGACIVIARHMQFLPIVWRNILRPCHLATHSRSVLAQPLEDTEELSGKEVDGYLWTVSVQRREEACG